LFLSDSEFWRSQMKTKQFLRYALIFSVGLFFVGPAFTQLPPTEPVADGTTATATVPVAHVYVATTQGVYLYDAAASGKLTLVSGSPFKTKGLMVGSNGKYFFSVDPYLASQLPNGANWIHSYPVTSNGTIKAQVSQINMQDYTGADCGNTVVPIGQRVAVLDHSGQHLYVLLGGSSQNCNALQSFAIGKYSGALTFKGAVESGYASYFYLPSFIANDKFAYANVASAPAPMTAFIRDSNDVLQFWNFKETDPAPWSTYPVWIQAAVTADPTNHLAVVLQGFDPSVGEANYLQLASYTVDSVGNIVSTNRTADMPTPEVCPLAMRMSPTGKLLAIGGAGNAPGQAECVLASAAAGNSKDSGATTPPGSSGFGAGLQVFHFNGANPITSYSGKLTSDTIYFIQWDKANHLYATSWNKLYVFTVTPTSISQAPGSPYALKISPTSSYGAAGLIVVPQ
jgi:hypothetical protein